jgi:two-component system, LytTR family, response regulator
MGARPPTEKRREPVRTVVVDDEPLARQGIRKLLAEDPAFILVAECRDGVEAVATIQNEKPDLVILDVQMPEVDGFGVITAIGAGTMPPVVFVTAHDKYAVDAFNVHAIDYLLKPVDPERFRETLKRVKQQIESAGQDEFRNNIAALLAQIGGVPKPAHDRIAVRSSGKVVLVPFREIRWIEASGDYITLHTISERHTLRETMASAESMFPTGRFIRIHRSFIVNIDFLRELRPLFRGEYAVILTDGTRLVASRTYRERLESFLGSPR